MQERTSGAEALVFLATLIGTAESRALPDLLRARVEVAPTGSRFLTGLSARFGMTKPFGQCWASAESGIGNARYYPILLLKQI
jgi:hypothetical protein